MAGEEKMADRAFDEAFHNAEESTLSAYRASSYNTIADFLASPACKAQTIILANNISAVGPEVRSFLQAMPQIRWGENALFFKLGAFRRVSHQDGFWDMLCCGIPTCTTFVAANADTLSDSEIRGFCDGLASDKCTFHTLMLHGQNYGGAEMNEDNCDSVHRYLWPALLRNVSVKSLSIITRFSTGFNLFSTLTQKRSCPLEELTIYITPENVRFAEIRLEEVLKGLAENTISLGSLCIHSLCTHRISPPEEFGKMLATNLSLTSLHVRNCHVPSNVFCMLFSSLATNRHLRALSLVDCDGAWPPAMVLDSLQTNTTFHELNLQGTPLQHNAAICVQLASNSKNAEQRWVLQRYWPRTFVAANKKGADESDMVKPTAVRVFLCGLPYSGKTTLCQSFVDYMHMARPSAFCHGRSNRARMKQLLLRRGCMPERTRGIDISTLEDGDLRVSLWDLAGQTEYHTFHNYMFPNFSSRATPAFFLFVWNPIEVDEQGGHKTDPNGDFTKKSIDKFEKEFEYWLRFIASKTLRSEKFNPRLIIVITRKDCGLTHMREWIHDTLCNLQGIFGDIIHFDMEGLFEIDAREPMALGELADYLFGCAKKILDLAPKVHAACKEARSGILSLVEAKRIAPLITRDAFQTLCEKELGIFSKEVQEAIALSLNDSGDLIYFPSLQFVVVDTQWFCHDVMGDPMSESILTQSNGRNNPQGMFSIKFLEGLLEKQLNSAAKSKSSKIRKAISAYRRNSVTHTKVRGDDLVKLLVQLQIACYLKEDEGNLNVFIPASLRRKNFVCAPHFLLRQEGIKAYLGRRLKCKDSKRTFLTPVVFPLLQVVFYSSIQSTHKKNPDVTLEEDLISYAQEGNGVIIEFCKQEGEEHFIDVLFCSHLEPVYAIKWVHKNVITMIERVCAQPRGIQGVELEHEVIQPECVKDIGRIENRTQSVSVKELKERLERHLREEGFGANGFDNVLHTWIPDGNSHRVDELLAEEATLQIVEAHWRSLSVAATDALGVVQTDIGTRNVHEKVDTGNLEQQRAGKAIRKEKQLYNSEAIFQNKLDEILSGVKQLLKETQTYGKKIDDLRAAVIPRLNDLFTFLKERETKLPRMIVVNREHSGLRIKVATTLVPKLSRWRLELLCECKSGPHPVKGSPGIGLTILDDGLLKSGLPYINTFLKVANVALKVGAHLTVGLGHSIPDFSQVLALIEDTNELSGLPTCSDPADPLQTTSFASRENFQKGQEWLLQVLSSQKLLSDSQIRNVFGLSRIEYPSGKFAWVCSEHTHEGELRPAWF